MNEEWTRRDTFEAWAAAVVGGLLVILIGLYIIGLPVPVILEALFNG